MTAFTVRPNNKDTMSFVEDVALNGHPYAYDHDRGLYAVATAYDMSRCNRVNRKSVANMVDKTMLPIPATVYASLYQPMPLGTESPARALELYRSFGSVPHLYGPAKVVCAAVGIAEGDVFDVTKAKALEAIVESPIVPIDCPDVLAYIEEQRTKGIPFVRITDSQMSGLNDCNRVYRGYEATFGQTAAGCHNAYSYRVNTHGWGWKEEYHTIPTGEIYEWAWLTFYPLAREAERLTDAEQPTKISMDSANLAYQRHLLGH